MAAPRENLLSPGHLSGTERNTFPKQREHTLKKRPLLMHANLSTLQSDQRLRVMHLQQQWQELEEREIAARQHNRQLLLQFEKAQDTLTEMLTLTVAMKTIRMEYERYLDESAPRWHQQLKEKTQAAQRKKMEEYLKLCSKNTDDGVKKSSSDGSLFSQGATTKPPQKPPTQNSHYNQDGLPHLSSMQTSWQAHPPYRVPQHPHIPPSYLPQPFLPPATFPHPVQLHHLNSTPTPHPAWPKQHPSGWLPTQPDSAWPWTRGIFPGPEALWGQLCTEGPLPERGVPQVVREEMEMSGTTSSKRDRGPGSGSSHASLELDTKPVRLSSGPAESSESSMESSQSRREKRKRREKTGRSRHSSSDRERCSSQQSSRSSSVIITAAGRAAQSSESDASSGKSRSTGSRGQRSAGLAVGSPRAEKVLKEKQLSNGEDSGSNNEESRSTEEESRSEEAEKQSPNDRSENCREESGSQGEEHSGSTSIKIDRREGDEIEQEESNSSEGQDEEEEHEVDLEAGPEVDSSEEQDSQEGEEQEEGDEEKEDSLKDEENKKGDEEEKEDSQGDDEQEEGDEDDEKEEETEDEESEEEKSDGVKDEDAVKREQSSASSRDEEVDEDESEGGDDMEEEEEESYEEEQMRDRVEEAEERDSEDSIISPQKKSGQRLSVPEEVSDEEQSAARASVNDSDEFSDEDIEHLLAPQEQSQGKQVKDSRAEEKPTAPSDMVEPFRVETDKSAKTIHLSDADEFDDFYD